MGAVITLGGYLAILLILFFATPVAILIVRRFGLAQSFDLQSLLRKVPFERLKALVLQNRELSKRPLSMQLEAFLYSQTNWGYIIDVTQAVMSILALILFIIGSYMPLDEPAPVWSIVCETLLTLYFLTDFCLRFYLAQDRLAFYFTWVSILDFVTIVPGLVSVATSESAFDANAWMIARTARVLRIFRVVRMARVVALTPGSSFHRQIAMLAITVLAMVFVAAGIYQICNPWQNKGEPMPFHRAVLYMTIIVIGRPPVPHDSDASVVMVTLAIMIAASVIPAFVAELARLYFETQGLESYKNDPRIPHVIVCGDINTSRLKAFLGQFFHKSRDPEILSPVVVLAEHKYEGSLRSLIEQSRYHGTVTYIRGVARRPADLRRAGIQTASTVIVLCSRAGDATDADSDVVSSCLAIKSVNRRIRILAQIRRPRSGDHIKCLPGWRDHDRAVAIASLAMTLVGVGSIVPGLPTLLTNLIHQGNKAVARNSNPRRRLFLARHQKTTAFTAAGMIVAEQNQSWWAAMMEAAQALNGNADSALSMSEADLFNSLRRSLSPLEEYTSGFAQEMFAFAVTPGLAGRSFGAAARLAYMRYGVLLIGARIPVQISLSSDNGGSSGPSTEPAYQVLLFPCDLILAADMYVHAIGFDTVDLANLLEGTGGEHALKHNMFAKSRGRGGLDRTRPSSAALNTLGHHSSGLEIGASAIAVLGDAAVRQQEYGLAGMSSDWGHVGSRLMYAHNQTALTDLRVPWCLAEQDEDDASVAIHIHDEHAAAAANDGGASYRAGAATVNDRVQTLTTHKCKCIGNEAWATEVHRATSTTSLPSFAVRSAAAHAAPVASSAPAHRARAATVVETWESVASGVSEPQATTAAHAVETAAPEKLPPRPPPKRATASRSTRSRATSDGTPDDIIRRKDTGVSRISEADEEESGAGGNSDTEMEGGTVAPYDQDEDAIVEDDEEGSDGGEEDAFDEEDDRFTAPSMSRASAAASHGPHGSVGNSIANGVKQPQRPAAAGDGKRMKRAMSDIESVFTIGDDGLGDDEIIPAMSVGRRTSMRRRGGTAVVPSRDGARGGAIVDAATGEAVPSVDVVQAVTGISSAGRAVGIAGAGRAPAVKHRSAPLIAADTAAGRNLMSPPGKTQTVQLPAGMTMAMVQTLASMPLMPRVTNIPRQLSLLSTFHDHILVCGVTDRIGLLLRALHAAPPPPPKSFVPGLSSTLYEQAMLRNEYLRRHLAHGKAAVTAGLPHMDMIRPPTIVVLCPVTDRPNESLMNSKYPGSSALLSKVTWVNGSPTDMSDLLRAGVETARAAIALSTRKLVATADGNDNLSDDVDAIVESSCIYRLNPNLHLMTEVIHGQHAAYLRPCGTNLTDAEETTSAFVTSIRTATAMRAKYEAKMKRLEASKAAGAQTSLTSPSGRMKRQSSQRHLDLSAPAPTAPTADVAPAASSTSSAASAAMKAVRASIAGTIAAVTSPKMLGMSGATTPQHSGAAGSPDTFILRSNSGGSVGAAPVVPPSPAHASAAGPPALTLDANAGESSGQARADDTLTPASESGGSAESVAGDTPPVSMDIPPVITSGPDTLLAAGLVTSVGGALLIGAVSHPDETQNSGRDYGMSGDDQHGSLAQMAAMLSASGEDSHGVHATTAAANVNADSDANAGTLTLDIRDKLARERIRMALAAGDSVGRTTMAAKPHARPTLRGVFGNAAASAGAAPPRPSRFASTSAALPSVTSGDTPAVAAVPGSAPAALPHGGFEDAPPSSSAAQPPTTPVLASQQVVRASSFRGEVSGTSVASNAVIEAGRGSSGDADAWTTGVSFGGDNDPWAVRGEAREAQKDSSVTLSHEHTSSRAGGLGSALKSFRVGSVAAATAAAAAAASAGHAHAASAADVSDVAVVHIAPPRSPEPSIEGGVSPVPEGLSRQPSDGAPAEGSMVSRKVGLAADAAAPTAVAPSDLFGAPAFAAGRAFSAQTIDALMCEAHFAPHIIFIIKKLVQASRKQQLQLIPVADAIAMAMLVMPAHALETAEPGHSRGGHVRRPGPRDAGSGPAPVAVRTYGQLFEALLRGWHLLPLGLYRRLEPGAPPRPPVVTDPVAQFIAAFGRGQSAGATFKNEKSLLSYVFTNPPPFTVLNAHDFVYALRPGTDSGDGDE